MWKRGLLAVGALCADGERPRSAKPTGTRKTSAIAFSKACFDMQPRWYAFFYLTTRLGLRTGEVYAISQEPHPRHPAPAHHRPGGSTRQRRSARRFSGPRKNNQGANARAYGRRASTRSVGTSGRATRETEFLFSPRRHLPGSPRQPQTAAPDRAAGPRAPGAQPSPDRPPLGGQPGRDRRPVHQGDPSPARPSLGAKHRGLRPPRSTGAAPISRGVASPLRHLTSTSGQRAPIAKIRSAASP